MEGVLISKFGGPEVLEVKNDLPIPTAGDNDVLIQVKFHGVNPVDTYLRSGVYPKLPSIPYIPGKDASGIVIGTGKNVTSLKKGARVFCSKMEPPGTMAQIVACDQSTVFPLPDNCTFEVGAALFVPYMTAYRALFIANPNSNDRDTDLSGKRILIHGGTGAVGQACIQLAKAKGASVWATAGTTSGLSLLQNMGVDGCFNHSDDEYVTNIKNQHQRFDLILEMLANRNLQVDLEILKAKGAVVIIGCRGEIQINPRSMMAPETCIVGCSLNNSTQEDYRRMEETIVEGLNEGWIKPTISKIYSLQQSRQAHQDVVNMKGLNGKLLIRISS